MKATIASLRKIEQILGRDIEVAYWFPTKGSSSLRLLKLRTRKKKNPRIRTIEIMRLRTGPEIDVKYLQK